jgi:tetratricopeptide (TPR) repeat protein
VLKIEPLSHEAIRAGSLLLAETESRQSAYRFLEELCERFPFSGPLQALRIEWLGEEDAKAVIPHLRRLLDVNPADSWAWREFAVKLCEAGDPDRALEAAQEAIRLDPDASAGFSVRAYVHSVQGRLTEARADFEQAVRLDVDHQYALLQFVQTGTLAERMEALGIVASELRRQVIFRGALEAYQTAARGMLPPAEVLALLREAHAARPDLSQAWCVLVRQLTDMCQYEEARKLALEAVQRFPLIPEVWVELARVEQARLDTVSEIAALDKAIELRPGYAYASRQLAGIYLRQNELGMARGELEEAVAANPLDALNHGCMATSCGCRESGNRRLPALSTRCCYSPGMIGLGMPFAVGQPKSVVPAPLRSLRAI